VLNEYKESANMKPKRRFLMMVVILMFSVFLGAAYAQEKTASVMFSESDAQKITMEWAAFVGQGNVPELEKLLNDKYMHIHGTALVESKTKFLEAFINGSRKYDPIKIEDMNIRVFGNSAVVTGKFNLKAFVRGKAIEGVNRFGLVLAITEKGKQVVSFQATAIPQQK
jgi:hypothetical protein